jgi:hypothetical protein
MPLSKQCPKCAGSMSEGFVLDKTQGGAGVSSWIEGAPVRSLWTGVDIRGREQSLIATWRCGRCGFLESYATGEPDGTAAAQKRAAAIIVAVVVALSLVLALVGIVLAHHGR